MKERICDQPVDLRTSLREVLGDVATTEYYLGVFLGMAGTLSRQGKSCGFCSVLSEEDQGTKSVVVFLGRNGKGKTVEMMVKISNDGVLLTGKEIERHHLRSPLIKPATTEKIPDGAYALATRGGTLILLGIDQQQNRPMVLGSYSP